MSLSKPKVSAGKFHHICGKNIQFSEERTVAERVKSYYGIVYTEQPIPVGTTFQIKLLKTQDLQQPGKIPYMGSLALGLTTESPGSEVLELMFTGLCSHQSYWLLSPYGKFYHGSTKDSTYPVLIERSFEVGQSLGCVVNENGDLHYFVDGKDQGLACTGLPTDQPLWGVVDIYGKAEKIKSEYHIHHKQQCQNCLQLEQQLSSETSRLKNEASQMQQDFDRHLQGLEGRLRETEQQLDLKRREVEEREREVQRLQGRLQDTEQQLDRKSQEVEEREQEVQALQQRFDTAMAELRTSPQITSQHGIEAWKVPRDEVQILGELDRGAWGVVARGNFRGQLVAVKLPHPAILNEHTIERLRREVRIMAQLHHPNLLHFIAAVFDDRLPRLPPLIVMELLDTNLRAAYQNGRLSDVTKMPIFQDVAYALHYIPTRAPGTHHSPRHQCPQCPPGGTSQSDVAGKDLRLWVSQPGQDGADHGGRRYHLRSSRDHPTSSRPRHPPATSDHKDRRLQLWCAVVRSHHLPISRPSPISSHATSDPKSVARHV